jgi:transposase-like protein
VRELSLGWHLDEVYLKIAGRMVCLWRASAQHIEDL